MGGGGGLDEFEKDRLSLVMFGKKVAKLSFGGGNQQGDERASGSAKRWTISFCGEMSGGE